MMQVNEGSLIRLYPHQSNLLALNPDRYLLAHGTGAGKTLMALMLADSRRCATLIICPKHLKKKWQRDAEAYEGRMLVLTKEEFKKAEPTLPGYQCVIVDEAHTFAGVTSQLHKSLLRYFKRHQTPYRYLLTASPYLSTPWNIYALALLLGMPLSYPKFRQTFFAEIRMGHRFVWKAREGQKYRDMLKKIIDKIGSSVQLSDVFDVPAQKHEPVMLDLTIAQEAALKNVFDPVAIVQWTRMHQVENGYLVMNDMVCAHFPNAKEEWVKNFAKENKKFVVFVRYLNQIAHLRTMLLKEGHSVLEIHGQVPDRDFVIRQANELKEVVLIVQAQCSEGYELPTFSKVVYASMSFSYKDLIQSQGRVLRANALHENDYYYLIMEGGVDEEVYKALQNKQDFSFELLSNR